MFMSFVGMLFVIAFVVFWWCIAVIVLALFIMAIGVIRGLYAHFNRTTGRQKAW